MTKKHEQEKVSYCAVHHTFPEPGEPCWQCANPFIDKAFKEGVKKGIKLFAYWKDGVQYVGMNGTTLQEALARVEEGSKTK